MERKNREAILLAERILLEIFLYRHDFQIPGSETGKESQGEFPEQSVQRGPSKWHFSTSFLMKCLPACGGSSLTLILRICTFVTH
jgi:hypothetical protein